MSEPTRKVTPPSSLTQTACTDLPAANLPTTAGTGGWDDGNVTGRLFSPLQAAHSREHYAEWLWNRYTGLSYSLPG
jgi:hypothetical protein